MDTREGQETGLVTLEKSTYIEKIQAVPDEIGSDVTIYEEREDYRQGCDWDDEARDRLASQVRSAWRYIARGCDRLPSDLRERCLAIVSTLFAIDQLATPGIDFPQWELCHGAIPPLAADVRRSWREVRAEFRRARRSSETRYAVRLVGWAAEDLAKFHDWLRDKHPPCWSPRACARGFADMLCIEEEFELRDLAERVVRGARQVARLRVRIGYATPEESSGERCRVQLREQPADRTSPLFAVTESCSCPVRLQGAEGENLRAFVNGVPVEPELCPGTYRAIEKMIRAFVGGCIGIPFKPKDASDTREYLGNDQGDLCKLRQKHPDPWAKIIFTPGTRGPVGKKKLYGIKPTQPAQFGS